MKAETKERIVNSIINTMNQGVAPWRKPWSTVPQQSVKGHSYRGINRLVVEMTSLIKGYTDPRWVTFDQCKKQGGTVRKGEKGTLVLFWSTFQKVEEDKEGKEKVKVVPLSRGYTLFNVGQTTLDVKPLKGKKDHAPIEKAEQIVAGYQNAPSIVHSSAGRACYSPSRDVVTLPEKGSFSSVEEYYGTLFHELVHSTGHKTRLAVLGDDEVAPFGSEDYGREELRAEIGAAMLCAECGIDPSTLPQSASYIDGWIKTIKGDTSIVFWAAQEAQKAVDLILGKKFDNEEERTEQ